MRRADYQVDKKLILTIRRLQTTQSQNSTLNLRRESQERTMKEDPRFNSIMSHTAIIDNASVDLAVFSYRSLAISEADDDETIRKNYRPFLLAPEITAQDWISRLELGTVVKMSEDDLLRTGTRLKVLVLYGSLRQRYV